MRIIHLPYYEENPYQRLLMEAQRELGHEVWPGGGGGNFFGVALREWKADVLHFHWLHPYLLRKSAFQSVLRATRFLAEVAVLKCRGARIAWTIHNLANHEGAHPRIEQWFTVQFARLADVCFIHSQAAGESASQAFGIPQSKLHIIPHGHYIGVYPDDMGEALARVRLGLTERAKVFLFLGRVEPYKGVFDLLDAFASLPDHCHLVIAGKTRDPEQAQLLSERCAKMLRVHHFPGRVGDNEMQQFFLAADVVVFPFRKILTSGSLVLAMSFGKAVVIPKVPSLLEIVPEGGADWFDPLSAESLADAMTESLKRDTAEAGKINFARAQEWDWKMISAITLEALKRDA